MFSESDGYERFMGRWSRPLAPLFVTFAGVAEGDRVGGARRRHLSALPKSRQSCGSTLMFGNTA